jgi:hypothetical protein
MNREAGRYAAGRAVRGGPATGAAALANAARGRRRLRTNIDYDR